MTNSQDPQQPQQPQGPQEPQEGQAPQPSEPAGGFDSTPSYPAYPGDAAQQPASNNSAPYPQPGQPVSATPPTAPQQSGAGAYGEIPAYGVPVYPNYNTAPAGARVFDSVGYGFNSFFANFGPWILFSLIMFAVQIPNGVYGFVESFTRSYPEPGAEVTVADSMSVGGTIVQVITVLVTFVITAIAALGAIKQVNGRKITIGEMFSGVPYGRVIGLQLLVAVVQGLAMIPLAFGLIPLALTADDDPNEAVAGIAIFFGAAAVSAILYVLISPLFSLMIYALVDENLSVGQAFKRGFNVAKNNYLKTLGFTVIIGVLNSAGALLCGFGLLLTMPAVVLASAHFWRSLIGGTTVVPEQIQ